MQKKLEESLQRREGHIIDLQIKARELNPFKLEEIQKSIELENELKHVEQVAKDQMKEVELV